jgi:type IV pilus assembly protein PilA
MKNKKGFTLVEIMIVVVIIGLLAAMAIPAFNKVRQSSRESAVKNNLRQLANAADQYMLQEGVTQAAYADVVGTQTNKYIKSIKSVAGEDYTGITIGQGDTEVEISSAALGTVSYEL